MEPWWKTLHRIADRATPTIKALLTQLIQAASRAIDTPALEAAIAAGDLTLAMSLIGPDRLISSLRPPVARELRHVLEQSATARTIAATLPVKIVFDPSAPVTTAWMTGYVGNLMAQMRVESAAAVGDLLRTGFAAGRSPSVLAREVRGSLGLAPKDVRAAEHYREWLGGLADRESLTGLSATSAERLRRSAATSASYQTVQRRGLTPARIESLMATYRFRLLEERAAVLSRTMSIKAANQGHLQLWAQAVEQGLVKAGTVKIWTVTPDDALCPYCEDVDGAEVPLEGMFESGLGAVDAPPLHPNCRCAIQILSR